MKNGLLPESLLNNSQGRFSLVSFDFDSEVRDKVSSFFFFFLRKFIFEIKILGTYACEETFRIIY